MKARIINDNGFWYGEVYGTWKIILLDEKWTGWRTITPPFYTKLGAKYELHKWCNKNIPKEFDI